MTPPPDPSRPVLLHCFYALFKYSLEKILACILFFPFPAYSFLAFCFLYFCTFIFVLNIFATWCLLLLEVQFL